MSRRVLRVVLSLFLVSSAFASMPSTASAQVVQSFNAGLGWFIPRGLDGRPNDDVFLRNAVGELVPAFDFDPEFTDALATFSCGEPRTADCFEFKRFRGVHFFGEWNLAFGNRVEVGAGVGVFQRTVPTLYRDIVNGAFEPARNIEQEVSLRVVPVTGVVRFLPIGGPGDVQPYVGVGVAALNFRYRERGDFVDVETGDVFCAGSPGCSDPAYVAKGTALGGLWLVGLRLPLGGDIYGLNLEYRRLYGKGDAGIDKGFVADKIDLGAGTFTVGFQVRF